MEIKVATFQYHKVALVRTNGSGNKYHIEPATWGKDEWETGRIVYSDMNFHDANAQLQRYIDEEDYTLEVKQ
jgi:ferric-dicitrate binding protein FerR (iron transport regulator)